VVLGHVVSQRGIEVDKRKIKAIERLSPSTCVKGVRSFLEHTSFYWNFITDFLKTTKSFTFLLAKDTSFVSSD